MFNSQRSGGTHDCAAEQYVVAVKELSFFRLSEEVIAHDVVQLAEAIASNGVWTAPIPVERSTGIIMDGNHRWHAAANLGLTHLPCVLVDYADPRVEVYDWNTELPFVIEEIFRVVMGHKVFPYKTTRHLFTPALPKTDIALIDLMLPERRLA